MKENNTANTVYSSVGELASDLMISRQSAYTGLRNGTIPSIRLGKRFVIPRAAIKTWLETAGADFRPAA